MENLQLFTSSLNTSDCVPINRDTTKWLLDICMTHHYMTPQNRWFRDYKQLLRDMRVYLGNNHSLTAVSVGNLYVTLPSGVRVTIPDIYHILGLNRNILLVTTATSTGSSIEFFHESYIIHFKLPNGEFEIIRLTQKGRMYQITLSMSNPHHVIGISSSHSLYLIKVVSTLIWNYRFGHVNSITINHMVKNKLCVDLPLYLREVHP
jgi:hypothetical protein